jgi:DNA-binding CsgD family transcriptional regulator
MERLSAESMQALLDFLESAAAVQDLNGFRAQVARSIQDVIPCDIVAYNEIDLVAESTVALIDPVEAVPPALMGAFNEFRKEHPLIQHYAEARDGHAVRLSDFLSTSQFHRLGLYAEFFARVSVEHQIAFVPPAPEAMIVGVALNRMSRDFDETERMLLDLARPHLIQSYRQAQEITLLRAGLAESGQELVMLHRDHWRIESSERARRWLEHSMGGAELRFGRLPDALRGWVALQRLRFNGGDLPRESNRLVFQSEGEPVLSLRYLVADGTSEYDALLLRRGVAAPTLESIASLGLSRRESELLVGVAAGLTNLELAEQFSISERTVEKHLSHVYFKLGVETRTAAVARAHQAAREYDVTVR